MHGILLVDTSQSSDVCLYIYICVALFVRFEWQRARIEFRGAVVNVILWSYELQLFFRYVSTGLQHALGRQETETHGNAIEQRLAFTCQK